jgi:hypothetical protein
MLMSGLPSGALFHTLPSSHTAWEIFARTASSVYPVNASNFATVT